MIVVKEPTAGQMPQQSRLLDIDPTSQSLYSQQQFNFDKSSINAGADLKYASNGNNRIKIHLAGQGVINLAKSSLCFRYKPIGLATRAPIYGQNIATLFEVESFQINGTSILTGSSRSYLFDSAMRVFQSKADKQNNWLQGADGSELGISGEELKSGNGALTAVPSLQQKLYQRLQSGRILSAYRHYNFSSTGATILSDDEEKRSMANQYSIPLADLLPQIASMGVLGEKFPLAFVNSIQVVLRLVDPVINHVMCAHPFGDTTTYSGKNLDKTEINYEISDVTMLKIESTFNGDSAKATYAQLLQEQKISTSYTDFEFSSFDITNAQSITATVPVSIRDLRMILIGFTLKDSKLREFKSAVYSATDYVMHNTKFNHPWIAGGLHFFTPAMRDLFVSINGQGRLPSSQPQVLNSTDFAPVFTRACLKQLIGNSAEYDHGYLDTLSGQQVFAIPWQREAFAQQGISLADQSNLLQVTASFHEASFQPGAPAQFDLTDLQMVVFRVFDKQIALSKFNTLIY